MKKVVSFIYSKTPNNLKKRLGKSLFLKPLRDLVFRKGNKFREIQTVIKRKYLHYCVHFNFFASIQIATKASKKGVENTLLKNSILVLNKYKPNKNEDYTIMDIGANFGFLSLVWSKTVALKGKVFSFEPHKDVYQSFIKSIKANNLEKIITLENSAVGKNIENIRINLSTTTSNTLKTSNTDIKKNTAEIRMVTLDHYTEENNISVCDLIKIDVDGIELDILQGAEKCMRNFKPIVIVELNGEQTIIDFMEKLGYNTLNMKLEPIKKNELPSNAFFVPN